MHANDLIINDSCAGEAVEGVTELLPYLDREPPPTLIIETIDPVDSSALMVASQDKEVFRILDLVGKEEADNFQALLAPIHIISKEEVVGLRGEATVLKQPEDISVLSVDISAYLDGSPKLQEHRLAQKHVPGLVAELGGIGH